MEISIPSNSIICFIWHKEHQQPKDFQPAIYPFNLAPKHFHSLKRKDGSNLQSCRIDQSTATVLDFPRAPSGCMAFNNFASQRVRYLLLLVVLPMNGGRLVQEVPFGLHFSLALRM